MTYYRLIFIIFLLINCFEGYTQIVWVKIEELPKSLLSMHKEIFLYNKIANGIIDQCNSYTLKNYNFQSDMRIVKLDENLPKDSFSLVLKLKDTVLLDKKEIYYHYNFSEKNAPGFNYSSSLSIENKNLVDLLEMICKFSLVVFHRNISQETNIQHKNLTTTQIDSLNLGQNFRNVIVVFKINNNINERDIKVIEKSIKEEFIQTQSNIYTFYSQKKAVYFNLYFFDSNYFSENQPNNISDPLTIIFKLEKKSNYSYLLSREVDGNGSNLLTNYPNKEIDIDALNTYPDTTTKYLAESFVLVKDLFELWGY